MNGDVSLRLAAGRVTLRLDFNALCAFEGETGKAPILWISTLERGAVLSAIEMRAMCWAMMLAHQPTATLADAGGILDLHPDLLTRVITAALPVNGAEGKAQSRGKKRLPRWISRLSIVAGFRRAFPRISSGV